MTMIPEDSEVRYEHEVHCNASRRQPMGCDMCTCTIGLELKKRRKEKTEGERLHEIYDGNGRLRSNGGFCE